MVETLDIGAHAAAKRPAQKSEPRLEYSERENDFQDTGPAGSGHETNPTGERYCESIEAQTDGQKKQLEV